MRVALEKKTVCFKYSAAMLESPKWEKLEKSKILNLRVEVHTSRHLGEVQNSIPARLTMLTMA